MALRSCRFALVLGPVLVGLLAGGASPATAQYFGRNKVQYDRFDFQSSETDHFSIYYYPEAQTAVRDASRMAERWYQRHVQHFNHVLTGRKALFFYANDADFQQTNIISGPIDQGTGGVTEGLKQRVVMPLTGNYRETDHVLGHELVHSFQYDLAFSTDAGVRLANTPLWLIEGMAEYLSLGRDDAHTAMWMRDAALRDDLPTIRQLTRDRSYFPYRYGQAYLAYVGGKYGDGAVNELFRFIGQMGLDTAVVRTLGITPDSLSREWQAAIKAAYLPLTEGRTSVGQAGRPILQDDAINVAPALSPDGRYVAFLSSRALFTLDLYIADTQTGRIVKKLRSASTDPHFDAIRFMNSAGAWSPDGEQFAVVTFAEGDNEIALWDVSRASFQRRIAVEGVTAIAQPAWSPDGTQIAFSGLNGGISDLYVLDLDTRAVRQLTNDRYADLQPTWSPDGSQIAFTTDRGPGGTNFQALTYGPEQLALIDVASGRIETLRPFAQGMHHNPQFAPDGRSLFFLADPDGFKDVYRIDLQTRAVRRVTALQTGVSGFTALAPALSVAAQSGHMVFSVFTDGRYALAARDPVATAGTSIEPASDLERLRARAGVLPPFVGPDESLVALTLDDPGGLPTVDWSPPEPYVPRLTLDYIAPPTIGVAFGGGFGTRLGGSVGFYFSDMLGHHNLSIEALANGTIRDIGGQVTYLNQARRLNYGAAAGHIPLLYGGAFFDIAEDPVTGQVTQRYNEVYQRVYVDQLNGLLLYPLQTTRRFELQAGLVRYGFDYQVERYYLYPGGGIRRDTEGLAEPDPVYLAQGAVAYVVDYSNVAFVSPVQGGRYRVQVGPVLGTANYLTVLGDARRYLRAGLVTVALRGLHIGNYGAKQGDVFASESLGYSYAPGFVRGYSFRSFDVAECSFSDAGRCPAFDRLEGTRIAVANAEVRVPLVGTARYGLIDFPYLPTELSVFADAGLAWTAEEAPSIAWARRSDERVPVVSVGASARVNLLGAIVAELFYAYPFQRPDKGAHWGLQLVPGW